MVDAIHGRGVSGAESGRGRRIVDARGEHSVGSRSFERWNGVGGHRQRSISRSAPVTAATNGDFRWGGVRRHLSAVGPPLQVRTLLGLPRPRTVVADSRAAPAAREPWPPTRRSPRGFRRPLTRPRHAAVSKTGPDGMRVRIAAIWW